MDKANGNRQAKIMKKNNSLFRNGASCLMSDKKQNKTAILFNISDLSESKSEFVVILVFIFKFSRVYVFIRVSIYWLISIEFILFYKCFLNYYCGTIDWTDSIAMFMIRLYFYYILCVLWSFVVCLMCIGGFLFRYFLFNY